MAEKHEDISIAARVPRLLYAKILKRRREAQQLTGIEPSLSAVVRAMIEEATGDSRRRSRARRSRPAAAA